MAARLSHTAHGCCCLSNTILDARVVLNRDMTRHPRGAVATSTGFAPSSGFERRQFTSGESFPRLLVSLLLLAFVSVVAPAAMASPGIAGGAEIEHLLDFLANSGCEFQRNGKWFDSRKARDHLRKKYEYLLEKNMVRSAEHFIERAASESSRSHNAYTVRCAGLSGVASATWLTEELARYRSRQVR